MEYRYCSFVMIRAAQLLRDNRVLTVVDQWTVAALAGCVRQAVHGLIGWMAKGVLSDYPGVKTSNRGRECERHARPLWGPSIRVCFVWPFH
jgi:hypothetical protein